MKGQVVSLSRIEDARDGHPQYAVIIDGERVGVVYRHTITMERKFRGQSYVYTRWKSKTFFWSFTLNGRHYWVNRTTRNAAVESLQREMLR